MPQAYEEAVGPPQPQVPESTGDRHPLWGLGGFGQEHPWEGQILGGSSQAEPRLVWSTGSVMVKSPMNRELVATYEVTLSVIDNASDLPEHSVSVPNGKVPCRHLSLVTQSQSGQGAGGEQALVCPQGGSNKTQLLWGPGVRQHKRHERWQPP